jgi:hypothetical protein
MLSKIAHLAATFLPSLITFLGFDHALRYAICQAFAGDIAKIFIRISRPNLFDL